MSGIGRVNCVDLGANNEWHWGNTPIESRDPLGEKSHFQNGLIVKGLLTLPAALHHSGSESEPALEWAPRCH